MIEQCQCDELRVVMGVSESVAYSKHMECVPWGEFWSHCNCPVTLTNWVQVWGVGASHGAGPARIEKVRPGGDADAIR